MSEKFTSTGSVTPMVSGGGPSGEGNALTQEEKLVGKALKKNVSLTHKELAEINSKKGLLQLLSTKNVNVDKALIKLRYE